ncbi:MAG: cell wall-binding repeat-containing protein [Eggerthellaceae bacterium]|nr:cell wall-binding repeat-containing protein [Eggerthellaceae bacterium]
MVFAKSRAARWVLACVLSASLAGVSGIAYADPNEQIEDEASEGVVQVLAGQTQFDTSAVQALQAFPGGASVAIVASGVIPLDALSASSLAGAMECPILLTAKDYLPESVASALEELGVSSVIIVGGPAVVTETVEGALASLGCSVERLFGATQFDTQLKIFQYGDERGYWDDSDTLIVASGMEVSSADALSASPIAYKIKAPVVLVDSKGRMSKDAKNELAQHGQFERVLIVGGKAVVSQATYAFMEAMTMFNYGSPNVLRLAGNTLYDTSAAVAQWATDEGVLQWDGVAFATGKNPFDSLGGSVVQGVAGSVLLLVDSGYLTGLNAAVQSAGSVESMKFFGGEVVMPTSLRETIIDKLLDGGLEVEGEGEGSDNAGSEGENPETESESAANEGDVE